MAVALVERAHEHLHVSVQMAEMCSLRQPQHLFPQARHLWGPVWKEVSPLWWLASDRLSSADFDAPQVTENYFKPPAETSLSPIIQPPGITDF